MVQLVENHFQTLQIHGRQSRLRLLHPRIQRRRLQRLQIRLPGRIRRILLTDFTQHADAVLMVALIDVAAVLLQQRRQILLMPLLFLQPLDDLLVQRLERRQFQIDADIAPPLQFIGRQQFRQLQKIRLRMRLVDGLGTHAFVQIVVASHEPFVRQTAHLRELLRIVHQQDVAFQLVGIDDLDDLLYQLLFWSHVFAPLIYFSGDCRLFTVCAASCSAG